MPYRYVYSKCLKLAVYPPELLKLTICSGLVEFISLCVMGKYPLYLYARHLTDLFYVLHAIFITCESDSSHACIDLDMDLCLCIHAHRQIRELLCIVHLIHGRSNIISENQFVIRGICVAQYQYGLIYICSSELQSLIDECHCKEIHQIIKCLCHLDSAVSIGVCLYDRQHLLITVYKPLHSRDIIPYIVKIYHSLHSVKVTVVHHVLLLL